jgi:hypothetical protein
MKKTLLLFTSVLSFCAYQGDRPSTYSYMIEVPVVNKSRSYEFYVSLEDKKDLKNMTSLGLKNRKATIPMVIKHDNDGDERIKLIALAYQPNGQVGSKKIASQYFYFKAPKGTAKKITEIDIDYSKTLGLSKRGKFNVTFKPNNLPIQ